jgi:hypothetical protein
MQAWKRPTVSVGVRPSAKSRSELPQMFILQRRGNKTHFSAEWHCLLTNHGIFELGSISAHRLTNTRRALAGFVVAPGPIRQPRVR